MPDTVSDHLLQRLEAWNVRRIFTYPGDGINGIMGARRRATEFAKLLGLDGIRVERPEDVVAAWERARASDVPFVIDALVDRNVPTLPPELKPEQEDKLAKALADSDADAEAVRDQLHLQEVSQR